MSPEAAAGPGPLIVTAELPDALQRWADALRRAHFPPERNVLAAHVTLFHALPPMLADEARALLADLAARYAPPAARVTGLLNLGRGTAIALASPALLALRDAIADRFHGMLTGQDQHRPRLHVTIQNKVTAEAARALQGQLAGQVSEQPFSFAGLALHVYRGGPWEPFGRWSFRGAGS